MNRDNKKEKTKQAGQIKSRTRVREKGEVFTELREINNILDLTADTHANYKDISHNQILEPAAGDGNFLVVILQRRLTDIVKTFKRKQEEEFHFAILLSLVSIYGVDIAPDNIQMCKRRMRDQIQLATEIWYVLNRAKPSPKDRVATQKYRNKLAKLYNVCDVVLDTNIIVGDMLNGRDSIVFTEWTSPKEGYFIRAQHRLVEMEMGIATPHNRATPVHYTKLATEEKQEC